MLPYGETHKWHRSILHKFFSTPNLLKYTESQQQGCYMFLRQILESPQDYDLHVRRYVSHTSITFLRLAYSENSLPTVVMMMNTYGHNGELTRMIGLGRHFMTHVFFQLRMTMTATCYKAKSARGQLRTSSDTSSWISYLGVSQHVTFRMSKFMDAGLLQCVIFQNGCQAQAFKS